MSSAKDSKNVLYKDWWLAYRTTPISQASSSVKVETKYTSGFRDNDFKEFNSLERPFEDFENMMLESCVTATEFYEFFSKPQMSVCCQGGKYLVTYSPKSLRAKCAAVSFFLTREEMLRVKLTEEDTFPLLDKIIENQLFEGSKNPGQMLEIPVLEKGRTFKDKDLRFMADLLEMRELIRDKKSNLYPSLSFHSNGKPLSFAQQLNLACFISNISDDLDIENVDKMPESVGFYIGSFVSEFFNSQTNTFPIFNDTDKMRVVASNEALRFDDGVLTINLAHELSSLANVKVVEECIKKMKEIKDIYSEYPSSDEILAKYNDLFKCVYSILHSDEEKQPSALDENGKPIIPDPFELDGACLPPFTFDKLTQQEIDAYNASVKQPPAALDDKGEIIEPSPHDLDGPCAPPFTFFPEVQKEIDRNNKSEITGMRKNEKAPNHSGEYSILPADIAAALRMDKEDQRE